MSPSSAFCRGLVQAAAIAAGVVSVRATPPQAAPQADAVSIFASVTLRSGRVVQELQREDFEVLEDGERRDVIDVAAGPHPLSIVLLGDVSGSMLYRSSLETIAGELAELLLPADAAVVGGIGPTVSMGARFTRDRDTLTKTARDLWKARDDFTGPSPLWDGLNTAAATLDTRPGRRAVILVTDGRATGNVATFDTAIRHALMSDIEVSGLISNLAPADAGPWTGAVLRPSDRPRVLVTATGGLIANAGTISTNTKDWLTSVIAGLRAEYRLTIRSAASGDRVHGLEVRVPRPGLTIRARRSHVR